MARHDDAGVPDHRHVRDVGEQLRIGDVAALLGLSPSRVRGLVAEDKLSATLTAGGHRRFRRDEVLAWRDRQRSALPRGLVEVCTSSYRLAGLDEHLVWTDVEAWVESDLLPTDGEAHQIARYVVTEIVNNAIDHSNGTYVAVTHARDVEDRIVLTVRDDGEGIFAHLANGLRLDSTLDSLAELTKGKRTTDPRRHTGEGIFFSSKAVDEFVIEANRSRLSFDNVRQDVAFGQSFVERGTTVMITLDPSTELRLADLFDRYTTDYEFDRTRPSIKLYEIGVSFISRSEAKRLTVGLERFAEVELDFSDVDDIGQGFADEVFRVWAAEHPTTTLRPIGMNRAVAFMVGRVTARADRTAPDAAPGPPGSG
jgi:excisionase family DNA binding protein